MKEEIIEILIRDLGRLHTEISAFRDEENLWRTTGSVTNCAGNIALHLIGNLNHYVGLKIGNTGFKRDRVGEFSLKNIPRSKILHDIKQIQSMIPDVLNRLEDEELNKDFPEEVFGHSMTSKFFLIHLSGHLMYHLGQINYLRRILEA